jgi:hypothetical protein
MRTPSRPYSDDGPDLWSCHSWAWRNLLALRHFSRYALRWPAPEKHRNPLSAVVCRLPPYRRRCHEKSPLPQPDGSFTRSLTP